MSGERSDRSDEGWAGHERAQLLRQPRLELRDKIKWLEEAHQVVQALQRARAGLLRASGSQNDS
jgi:hypothetical protein